MRGRLAVVGRGFGRFGGIHPLADYRGGAGGAIPKIVSDFVEEKYAKDGAFVSAFSDLLTFSRASEARYFDASGVMQTAASGTVRVGHHRGGIDKGLLLETEARTNMLTYSVPDAAEPTNWTDFVAGNVGKTLATLSNGVAGIRFQASGDRPRIAQTGITFAANTTYTLSVFLEPGGTSSSSGDRVLAVVNLSDATGTLGLTLSEAQAAADADGRVSITFTTGTDTAGDCQYGPGINSNVTADITMGGIQLEQAATRSSFIPTSAATVTRAAESLSIAAANMSANTTGMSFQMDGEMDYADEGVAAQQTFLRWQVDANNYISLDLDTDSTATGEVNANQAAAGTVDTVVAGTEYTAGLNTAFNLASRNASGAINVAKDGTAATADTTPTALADLSAAAFELGYDFMGTIALFRQWDVDIGDTALAEETA